MPNKKLLAGNLFSYTLCVLAAGPGRVRRGPIPMPHISPQPTDAHHGSLSSIRGNLVTDGFKRGFSQPGAFGSPLAPKS